MCIYESKEYSIKWNTYAHESKDRNFVCLEILEDIHIFCDSKRDSTSDISHANDIVAIPAATIILITGSYRFALKIVTCLWTTHGLKGIILTFPLNSISRIFQNIYEWTALRYSVAIKKDCFLLRIDLIRNI